MRVMASAMMVELEDDLGVRLGLLDNSASHTHHVHECCPSPAHSIISRYYVAVPSLSGAPFFSCDAHQAHGADAQSRIFYCCSLFDSAYTLFSSYDEARTSHSAVQ